MKKTRKSFSLIQSSENTLFQEALLGYLGGPVLGLIANSILSAYLNVYMTNVLNLTSWANSFVTLLPLISFIFVILGNVLVGFLINKNNSIIGKVRPLILVSVPLSLLALLFLFVFLPFHSTNEEGSIWTLIFLAIGYNLWYAVAYPFYFTSNLALVNLSTRDTRVRSLFGALSMASILGAFGLSNLVFSFFSKYLFVYDLDPTVHGVVGAIPQYDSDGMLKYYTDSNGAIVYDQLASYNAWKTFVIALIIITLIGVIVEFLFTRERISEELISSRTIEEKNNNTHIFNQLKVCLKDKYWILIVLFFLLYQFGTIMRSISQLYYCSSWFGDSGVYSSEIGAKFSGLVSIAGAILTGLGLLITWPLSRKFGKRIVIVCGSVLAMIGGFISFIAPDNFALLITSFVIRSFGIAPSMYLGISLLGDVLDNQEAKNNFRTDGFTMMVLGTIMSGMIVLSSGILNGILSALEYDVGHLNSTNVQNAMLWIFQGVEAISFVGICLLVFILDVEKHSKENSEIIIKRQIVLCEERGEIWISPEQRSELEAKEFEEEAERVRIEHLKKKCERKGLDFEEENQKYLNHNK